ncbi:MAG: xanthine dehydrogenase family protein molybdopterin-binding subunit [Rhodospirillaceae bacterium]|jgi:CO/xanthine dehydrogenase Mo-binding subunit|nr:xanthine dehydrogenase family protein molybdopterin-binding subunit [Rhodospirillaceae bacterium]MBT5242811.1 xanthine dehydrogenase family protein molybdopterin-binding subunit [Rhodospirillaceae bacterium]MBT5564012.1 xanthine dehydrogenase family protein molybdopterin-binding subunit [Rhodospirillaceae bacterium]MBT6243287.1 xanthine dehydrogenase family protein molybdopterin-binding subunit [Rhodospirillaceae bacterium]
MNAPLPKSAATVWDKATGKSRYTADLIPPGTIVAGMARSPHAFARVTGINTAETLKIPGVLGVFTAEDFEGIALGHQQPDQPVLSSVARYYGDGVAAVAARDLESLRLGLEALHIDYEVLPHVCTFDQALAAEIPVHQSCPDNVAFKFASSPGDYDAAAARVALWVEGTFETQAVPHAALEPRACLVRIDGDELELTTATHAPSVIVEQYRQIVESWGARLEIITPDIGGSFGARWEHPTHLVCLLFAHRLGRDVAMVLPRREDMIDGRTRLAMRIHTRLGATADGEFLVKETTVLADNGAYSLHGPPVTMAAMIRGDNIYRFSAIRAEAQLVYTNTMPSECFRGFGIPQSSFALEQLIDELARRLDMDPVALRRKNASRSGDTTIHGWEVGSCGMDECLDAVASRMDAHKQSENPPGDERLRTGYGVSAVMHCISNRGYDARFDKAYVSLKLRPDGTIEISSGEVEVGAGTVEVLKSIVAGELSMDREKLNVVLGHTPSGPYGLGSFASRTSFFAGAAAIDACLQFKTACNQIAAEHELKENASVAEVVNLVQKRSLNEKIDVTGCYEPKGVVVPDQSGYGNISPAYTFSVHGCCVQVDKLTGKVTVQQYWAAHDSGTIINPQGAIGQVIGGVTQGLGFALSEEAAVGENGQLLNPGYLDDRVATFPDAVPIDVIFVPTTEEAGPGGAKTIGEQPIIPVAGCVANAVYDAIGVRQYKLPMKPERVWRTLQDQQSKE